MMNATPDLDRVFPLSAGAAPRPALRAPALPWNGHLVSTLAESNRPPLRAWATRRATRDCAWTTASQTQAVAR